MLPDREAASVRRWLRSHPGVKLISRDWAEAYAEGAKRSAPRARQMADRYHILVNLRDTLKATLARQQSSLPVLKGDERRAGASSHLMSEFPEASPVPDEMLKAGGEPCPASRTANPRPQTAAERRRQISRAKRFARYEHIVALSRQGLSERTIVGQLHVSRQLVHRSVPAGSFPERAASGRRQSKLDPYLPYLRHSLEQGFHNGLQLAREIQAQGFRGSASLVGQRIRNWRVRLPEPLERVRVKKRRAVPLAKRQVSARQASWLFVKPKEQLTADQQELTRRICQANAELQELYQLGQDFVLMVKQRQPKRPDPWLA